MHQDVGCGECHVDPGVMGFVKAKLAGTRELYALVTKHLPHADPAHRARRSAPDRRTPARSATRSPSSPTRASRASCTSGRRSRGTSRTPATTWPCLIRPANADSGDPVSVHWHVLQDVTLHLERRAPADDRQRAVQGQQDRRARAVHRREAVRESRSTPAPTSPGSRRPRRPAPWTASPATTASGTPPDRRPGGRSSDGRRHDQPEPAVRQAKRRHPADQALRHRRGRPGPRSASSPTSTRRSTRWSRRTGGRDHCGDRELTSIFDQTVTSKMNTSAVAPIPPTWATRAPPAASGAMTVPTTRSSRDA